MNKYLDSAGIALQAIWGSKLRSLMTVLGNANWWTPRFLRRRADVNATEETRVLEPVG